MCITRTDYARKRKTLCDCKFLMQKMIVTCETTTKYYSLHVRFDRARFAFQACSVMENKFVMRSAQESYIFCHAFSPRSSHSFFPRYGRPKMGGTDRPAAMFSIVACNPAASSISNANMSGCGRLRWRDFSCYFGMLTLSSVLRGHEVVDSLFSPVMQERCFSCAIRNTESEPRENLSCLAVHYSALSVH